MKKFNQVIRVEVDVDSIAEKLLLTFNPDEKHRELITETIIGTALNSGNIGYIYNAVNGFTNNIDFKEKEVVICKETVYYKGPGETIRKEHVMGECTILEIDIYKSDKLYVEYEYIGENNEPKSDTKWVDHRKCSKVVVEPVPAEAML